MKRKIKISKKKSSNSLNKLSLFQKNDARFSKRCPLSSKNAPVIDYKNVSLLKKYVSDNGKIISTKITFVSYNKQRNLLKKLKSKNCGLYKYGTYPIRKYFKFRNIGDKVKVKDGYGRNFL